MLLENSNTKTQEEIEEQYNLFANRYFKSINHNQKDSSEEKKVLADSSLPIVGQLGSSYEDKNC